MGLRLAICAVCLAAIFLLAGRLSDRDGCEDARRAVFLLGTRGVAPQRALATEAKALREDCHDVDELSAGSVSMLLAGRGDDALALAREAARRGPEVFSAWVALEAAQRRSNPAAARRADARARALNPRWTGPAPLPPPRAGAGP